MPADEDAVRRWAAAHAGTVAAAGGRRATGDDHQLPPRPAETVLASVTEIRTVDGSLGVAWGSRIDGQPMLATGSVEGAAWVWDPDSGQLLQTLSVSEHTDYVTSVAWGYQPDGQPLLATGGSDPTVRIWNPDAGHLLQALSGHTSLVSSVAWGYEPDGQPLLASGSFDDTARIWNPATGELLHTLGHPRDVISVAWGYQPEGRPVLATGCDDAIARIWDAGTGQLLHTLNGHTGNVLSVAWGYQPDGQLRLATAGLDGSVRIWSADGVQFIDRMLTPEADNLLSVRWAPIADGRAVLAGRSTNGWYLWDGVTSRQLYTAAGNFQGTSSDNLDWALDQTGRLLLAGPIGDRQVQIWEVVLDPPVRPPPAPSPINRLPRERVKPPIAKPVTILDPPEEVTPDFPDVEGLTKSVERVSNVERHGDRVLVAAVAAGGEIQLWDVNTGALLRVIANPARSVSVAIESSTGRSARLAVGGNDGTARIWDLDTGSLLRTLTGDTDQVWSVAWGYGPAGQPPMLATGGEDGIVRIWDPDTGQILRTLAGHTSTVTAAAWQYRDGGRPLLATCAADGTARIWDPDAGLLLRAITGHEHVVWAVAWGQASPGHPPLLATGGNDHTVRIWNPDTGGSVLALAGHKGTVFTLEWAALGDGRPVLASAGADGTARIWDPDSGAELSSVPSDSGNCHAFALCTGPEGDLRLVVADSEPIGPPARVWRIAAGAGPLSRRDSDSAGHPLPWPATELSGWLLRLGGVGLWPPLGLLADLVDLTAQVPTARDGRLGALADESGIARLRALGWEPGARIAFAALIASGLTAPERYAPPADVTPAALRDALIRALAGRTDAARPSPVPVGEVRAAAGLITDRTVALLTILGPAACAADPLLPVRLAHRIPQLPALTPRELRLLATAGRRSGAVSHRTAAGTMVYSPGTAGLARTGPLTRLLPTQLALPGAMLTMRIAENELLYREHRAPAPPAPQPVTIILDTTPPTYGPAGNILRLAAHLMTAALWDHDRYPSLITLGEPAVLTELRHPADLIGIWASSTLDEPAGALATALATASEVGQPVVFASHFQTARACGYRPGPVTRLLTAHHPPEQPPSPPTGRWHRHLPPAPTDAQLTAAISAILGPAAEGGN